MHLILELKSLAAVSHNLLIGYWIGDVIPAVPSNFYFGSGSEFHPEILSHNNTNQHTYNFLITLSLNMIYNVDI